MGNLRQPQPHRFGVMPPALLPSRCAPGASPPRGGTAAAQGHGPAPALPPPLAVALIPPIKIISSGCHFGEPGVNLFEAGAPRPSGIPPRAKPGGSEPLHPPFWLPPWAPPALSLAPTKPQLPEHYKFDNCHMGVFSPQIAAPFQPTPQPQLCPRSPAHLPVPPRIFSPRRRGLSLGQRDYALLPPLSP